MYGDHRWSSVVSLPPHSNNSMMGVEQLLVVDLTCPQEGDGGLVRQRGQVGAGEVALLASVVTWTQSRGCRRLKLISSSNSVKTEFHTFGKCFLNGENENSLKDLLYLAAKESAFLLSINSAMVSGSGSLSTGDRTRGAVSDWCLVNMMTCCSAAVV